MGGYGSTRWLTHTKRETVDDSLSLSVSHLLRNGALRSGQHWSGSVQWKIGDRVTASIGVATMTTETGGRMTLTYTAKGRPVSTVVQLTTVAPHFGGLRWLFVCPECRERRASKLYMPPSSHHFRCRACHALTYKSSQESDKRVSRLKRLPPDLLLDGLRSGSVDYVLGLKASMSHIDRLMRLGGL